MDLNIDVGETDKYRNMDIEIYRYGYRYRHTYIHLYVCIYIYICIYVYISVYRYSDAYRFVSETWVYPK